MAKQYRKIQKNISGKSEKKAPAPKEQVGKDYVLMAVMIFTVLVTIAGWMDLDNLSRAMYSLLSISLLLTYARRHAKLKEDMQVVVERGSLITMGIAVVLFFASVIPHIMDWIKS